MAEDDRELKHPVSENKGSPDVPNVFSNAVPVTQKRSTVRDAARCHPLRSPVALCSLQRHPFTAEVRHQPPVLSIFHQASLPMRHLLREGPAWPWVLCGGD